MSVASRLVYRTRSHVRQTRGGLVDDRIVFQHVPKCGGVSINQAIRYCFGFRPWFRGELAQVDAVASRRAAELTAVDLSQLREGILLYLMAQPRVRYIGGHFDFSEKAYAAYGAEWKFVTVLRHPVSKWFSQYYYDRFKQSSHFKIDKDLEEFLESDRSVEFGCDYVTRFTEGLSLEERSSQRAIDQAISNVEKFSLVGVLEDLDRFTQDFERIFGARLFIDRLNTNPKPEMKRRAEESPELRARVEKICEPNLRVYERVLDRTHGRPDGLPQV